MKGVRLGCPMCEQVIGTYPLTPDGFVSAMADYLTHMVIKHWEEITSKREEVMK
jgi:hypothetical protein